MAYKLVFLNCDFDFESVIELSGRELGRDQVFLFFWLLYLNLKKKDILLTSKLENLDCCDLIINVDKNVIPVKKRQWFLNFENRYWTNFDIHEVYKISERVYSYDVERFGNHVGYVFFPIPLDIDEMVYFRPFNKKDSRYTMISGNKNFPFYVSVNNYALRQRYIDILKNSPRFDLYGVGWDRYYHKNPVLHCVLSRVPRFDKLNCYKGLVNSKKELANQYDFCFSFENTSEIKGYTTEKVFDCIKIGAIPIVDTPIFELEIDRTNAIIAEEFNSPDDVVRFCDSMSIADRSLLYKNFIHTVKKNVDGSRDVPTSANLFASQIEKGFSIQERKS